MGLFDRVSEPMSKQKFADTLIGLIKKVGESANIIYDAEKESLSKENSGVLNLGNAYKEYTTADKSLREKVMQKWVRAWFLQHKEMPDELEDVRPDLMPAVRGRGYFELTGLRMKMESDKVSNWPHQPLATHLGVGLVYDMHEAMRAINQKDLDEWGLTFYEAQEIAQENLRKLDHAFIGPENGAGIYLSANRDSYDATRLLLLDIFQALQVKGDIVAMVPNRDTLIVTGSDDTEGLEAMLALTEEALQQPGFISTVALRLSEDEWVPWLPAADHPLIQQFKLLRVNTLGNDYGTQKELFDKQHTKQEEDIFVATYTVATNEKTGEVMTYSVWVAGITSWIPETDVIAFCRAPDERPRMCSWDRVVAVVGDLMQPLDVYPERFCVSEFPTEKQFAEIGDILD